MRKSIWAFEIAAILALATATANANRHDITAPAAVQPTAALAPAPPIIAPPAAVTQPALALPRPDLRGTAGLPLSVELLNNGAGEIAAALTAREGVSANLAARMFELQASLVLALALLAAALLYQGFRLRQLIAQSARHFTLTHRPHLRLRQVWRQSKLAAGAAVSLDLAIANTGLSPACLHRLRLAMVVLPNGREVPPDLLSGRDGGLAAPVVIDCRHIPAIASGGSYLFTALTDGRSLTPKQVDELHDKTSKLYLVGNLEYGDTQGLSTRMIGFCRYLAVVDQRAVPDFSQAGRFRLVEQSEYEFAD